MKNQSRSEEWKTGKKLRLSDRKCIACGSSDFRLRRFRRERDRLGSDNGQAFRSAATDRLRSNLLVCESCGLGQVEYLPDSTFLEEAYSIAVDDIHGSQFEYRVTSFQRALKRITRSGNGPRDGAKWLDVGCAGGAFVSAARREGFDCFGLEPAQHLAALAYETFGPRIRQGTIDRLSESELFEVISYWDVLEHIAEPERELQKVVNHLAPRGFLVLNLPMIDTFSARALQKLWPFYLEVHLFYFTKKSIRQLLESTGFEVVSVGPYSQTLDLRYVLMRALGRKLKTPQQTHFPCRYWMGQRTVVARKRT